MTDSVAQAADKVTPVKSDEQAQLSAHHGTVSAQEVKAAAAAGASANELPAQFPSPIVSESGERKPYEQPQYNFSKEPVGLQPDGKTLQFGQYYSSEFGTYTKSADYLKNVENISKISLPGAKLKDEVAPLVAQYPNLQELDLQNGTVKEALPHLKSLNKLERLNLESAYIDDSDVKNVANVKSIQDLQLSNNYKLTDDAVRSIATMPNLKTLNIDSHNITPDGIKALSNSAVEKLTPPVFMEEKDADAAAHAFTQIKSLKELNIPLSRMTDAGMEQLAKANSIEKLNLSGAFNLTASSIDHLAKMTNLKELDLSYASRLRPSEISRLQAALPDCKIKTDLDLKGLDSSNDDRKQANKIGHNMWLLAGITQDPKRFADDVLTDISNMSQKQIDLTASMLESGPYRAKIQRNADNSIKSIAYNYDQESLKECLNHPLPGLLFVPEALSRTLTHRAYRGTGSDVTISFDKGKVSLEAKQYHDITGKGFWRGSDTVSTAYKPTIKDSRVPYYKPW